MFGCENDDPTAHFSYTDAINHTPPYLSHFKVIRHDTKFLRDGIKYKDMTSEQKVQLEQQVDDAALIDFDASQISKRIFNEDTDRKIIKNIMDNGQKDENGSLGKTIVFARDHKHAKILQGIFEKDYPQFMQAKKPFCMVIDNYEPRAEQLIDDFKGEGKNDNLTIAISVDMLDTGIDVPAILNLVFAKPVKSYVKFWQMIGRGTRLCPDLFSPGKDKENFCIFDHWGNFEYFGESPPEEVAVFKKSLTQQLFEQRIELAELALSKQDLAAFEITCELISKDINALPEDTIAVRDKWQQVKAMQKSGVINTFDAACRACLKTDIAPLMQWRDLNCQEDAYRFDLLMAKHQTAMLKKSTEADDAQNTIVEQITQLPINLSQVKLKIDWINQAKSPDFWKMISKTTSQAQGQHPESGMQLSEHMRRELRGIMNCRQKPKTSKQQAIHINVTDTEERSQEEEVVLDGLELAAYRHRVERILKEIFEQSPVLQRIKAGLAVDAEDIKSLIDKVILHDPSLNVEDLLTHFPNKSNRLDLAIRQIIGLDAIAVDTHFTQFVQQHPALSSHQMRFLDLIQKHIVTYGRMEIGTLYEEPFTTLHSEGIDGIFEDSEINDLLDLITQINDITHDGV